MNPVIMVAGQDTRFLSSFEWRRRGVPARQVGARAGAKVPPERSNGLLRSASE